MVRKNGYTYCDNCRKYLKVNTNIITKNDGDKQLTFCSLECESKYKTKPVRRKFVDRTCDKLNHLSKQQREDLLEILDCKYIQYVYKFMRQNGVDGKKFTDIAFCDEPQKRRGEFYALFKDENTADRVWARLMGWHYGYTEDEIESEMWETYDRVQAYLRKQ